MFVQHKQLKVLSVPASKVARLYTADCSVQLAFPGYSPQMASAYLAAISGGSKVLIVVGFYLAETKESIFFMPRQKEVPVEEAERVFEEGYVFAESMGFVLNQTDFHLLSSKDQQKLWQSLPICQKQEIINNTPEKQAPPPPKNEREVQPEIDLETYRKRSLESLGRFLSSL